nr:site-specific integrase [Halobacterium noricense]
MEPLTPQEAVRMYLEHRKPELSEKSLQNHQYRLDTLVEFCDEHDIENLNELSGRDLHRYRTWRSRDGISTMTLRTHLATLRVFLEFAASVDAVTPGLREKVVLPEVSREEESRDVKLSESRGEVVLDHLDQFEYASRDHVIFGLLWHTGIRLGTLRAFDVSDWDPDAPCLRVRHRPETETPLKNGEAAERAIAVGDYYAGVIDDYVQYNRQESRDDHDRHPLITSRYGRLSENAIRTTIYRWTRPCEVGTCPHERDPETCDAMESDQASRCPSSRSPHGIRRGALTRMLRDGTPEQVVSDRSDVSGDVLEQHYDQRTERERMELRKEFLDEL